MSSCTKIHIFVPPWFPKTHTLNAQWTLRKPTHAFSAPPISNKIYWKNNVFVVKQQIAKVRWQLYTKPGWAGVGWRNVGSPRWSNAMSPNVSIPISSLSVIWDHHIWLHQTSRPLSAIPESKSGIVRGSLNRIVNRNFLAKFWATLNLLTKHLGHPPLTSIACEPPGTY